MDKHKIWSKDFILICLSCFFQFMPFYMLLATLPLYVQEVLRGTQQETGMAVSAFMLSAVLFRPLIGKWVDELDKKKMLLLTVSVLLLSTGMYVFAGGIAWLLVVRFLHGIGFGGSTTATAAMAGQLVPAYRKGEGIGYFSTFMSLAMVLGPFLGLSIIAYENFTVLFSVCTALSAMALLCGIFVAKTEAQSSLGKSHRKPFRWGELLEGRAIPISVAAFLQALAASGIFTFISLYTAELGVLTASRYFFVMYAIAVIIPRPIVGRIFDRYGSKVVVYPALVFFLAGFIVLSRAESEIAVVVSGAILGLGAGVMFSVFQTMAMLAVPPKATGAATATYFFFVDAGMGVGAYALGAIAEAAGFRVMYGGCAVLVLCLAGFYTYVERRGRVMATRNAA